MSLTCFWKRRAIAIAKKISDHARCMNVREEEESKAYYCEYSQIKIEKR
jgi:hypothetical protein